MSTRFRRVTTKVHCMSTLLRAALTSTRRRATLMLLTWIYSRQSVWTGNFTLPFATCVTILISILQTFRSWAATSHLRPPMALLSHNSSDTPGLAPLMNVLFWGRCDFPISFSGRDILDDDHLQWHPLLIRHYTNFWPYYWSGPYNRIWLFT